MDVKYDQHFLVDEGIIETTIDYSKITNKDTIFEIGPGRGVLTKKILKQNPKKLISIEIDTSMKIHLDKLAKEYPNFDYHFGNGLEKMNFFEFDKLIANIPYSITEPLYKKILDRKVPFAILLHGKNFYFQILDEFSKWHYLVGAFYDIEIVAKVKGNKFEPETKVDSVLIKLELKKELTNFEYVVQLFYSKSLRTTSNALIYTLVDYLNISKTEANNIINQLNFDIIALNKIVDNLSNIEFCSIISKLKKYIKE
jgi:16S rRNA (adenine1518-N6/adenine1519-N6)-dimethyltransferase